MSFQRYSKTIGNSSKNLLPFHGQSFNKGIGAQTAGLVRQAGKQFYIPQDDSLVGGWLFDEGKGLFVRDQSIYGNHGVPGTFPSWVADGLDFNGSSHYVSIDGFVTESQYLTVGIWLASTQSGVNHILMDANPVRVICGWNTSTSGKIGLYSGGWKEFGDAPNDGLWHHIIWMADNDKARMYIDGSLFGTEQQLTPIDLKSATQVKIGSAYAGDEYYFDGTIHSAFFYNRVLTAEEIANIYNAGMYLTQEHLEYEI